MSATSVRERLHCTKHLSAGDNCTARSLNETLRSTGCQSSAEVLQSMVARSPLENCEPRLTRQRWRLEGREIASGNFSCWDVLAVLSWECPRLSPAMGPPLFIIVAGGQQARKHDCLELTSNTVSRHHSENGIETHRR